MPSPEKFIESLKQFNIQDDIVQRINEGYEGIVSRSPKKKKVAYFKRATDILISETDADMVHRLYESNACCKGGSREKASKEFARKYADIDYTERLKHIVEVPYMGVPVLESGNVICVHAVRYVVSGKYACACPTFNKSGYGEKVLKDYCYCCAGHFLHHYQIMLGVRLKTLEIVSSPLDSGGEKPCVIRFLVTG
ncbi:MAG: hypothetical protein ACI4JW_09905 [Oscillospiraceae bacterium]